MKRGDEGDPLLRQVLPSTFEWNAVPGYVQDPLAESAAVADTGVLQKYAGRVLLIATGACAVNCRYCFRRHFPYAEHRQGKDFPALDAIRQDPSVHEVILSGGDPLMLRDAHLARLLQAIAAIGHVQRLRIHTRLPVVIPTRVTNALIDTLHGMPQQVVIVLHFNHANELDDEVDAALAALSPFTLLNQSVVLQGVNNDADSLANLSERLFAAGVLPTTSTSPTPSPAPPTSTSAKRRRNPSTGNSPPASPAIWFPAWSAKPPASKRRNSWPADNRKATVLVALAHPCGRVDSSLRELLAFVLAFARSYG